MNLLLAALLLPVVIVQLILIMKKMDHVAVIV
jgi:hypothetical protein